MMLTMQEQLNLPIEYVMFSQNNLTCYWGNREELTDKQRKISKKWDINTEERTNGYIFSLLRQGIIPII